MSIALQQRFQSMSGVDGLSATIRTQLLDPISEDEYHRIEELPATQRDLVDTIKLVSSLGYCGLRGYATELRVVRGVES